MPTILFGHEWWESQLNKEGLCGVGVIQWTNGCQWMMEQDLSSKPRLRGVGGPLANVPRLLHGVEVFDDSV